MRYNNHESEDIKMVYAYCRVSTNKEDQTHARQKTAIESYAKENGFKVDDWIEERFTGKTIERPEYQQLKKQLRPDDILIISDIDRLGRNADEVILEIKELKKSGIRLISLDTPYLNDYEFVMANSNNSLYIMCVDILITLKAHIAQQEREKMSIRIKQGLEHVKEHGSKTGNPVGRPKLKLPKDFEKYYRKVQKGDLTKKDLARIFGVSRQHVYDYIALYEKETKNC